jgi:hypothetical protein
VIIADKHYVNCPECGREMSAHALLCRDCFNRSGGVGAPIYLAAKERGEASPRSSKYVKLRDMRETKSRAFSDPPSLLDIEEARHEIARLLPLEHLIYAPHLIV